MNKQLIKALASKLEDICILEEELETEVIEAFGAELTDLLARVEFKPYTNDLLTISWKSESFNLVPFTDWNNPHLTVKENPYAYRARQLFQQEVKSLCKEFDLDLLSWAFEGTFEEDLIFNTKTLEFEFN